MTTRYGAVNGAHPIATAPEALKFIMGGNARFTLRSTATGTRFSYRVRISNDKRVHFVRFREGPSYSYLGYVRDGVLKLKGVPCAPATAFSWTLAQLQAQRLPASLEVWHDGHCGRCGRALTVPESLSTGFGPECVRKI